MFKILTAVKSIFIHIRSSIKLIILITIAVAIMAGIISFFYKPTYAVSLNGELLGYTDNKTELQQKLNEYMEAKEEENVVFVDVEELPEYNLCFVKREVSTNDDDILAKIEDSGKAYYEYYAIVEDEEEKYYVATREEAEEVIEKLKKKKSRNIDKIAYTEVFGEELKEFTETDSIITALYKKPVSTYSGYSGSYTIAYQKVDLGISLTLPVKSGYTITSRFGARWGTTHTGTDVAAPTGTPIYAAAAGTVTFAGNQGNGYGNYIVIDHGNGVNTLYGHCSSLGVSTGTYVAQGQYIGAVGSTGNSTGPHLHFEVRKDGARYDPQNYVY